MKRTRTFKFHVCLISEGIWHKISQSVPKRTFWGVKFVVIIVLVSIIIIFASICWVPPSVLQIITSITCNTPKQSFKGSIVTPIQREAHWRWNIVKDHTAVEMKLKSMFVCLIWTLNVLRPLTLLYKGPGIFSFTCHTVNVAASQFSSVAWRQP